MNVEYLILHTAASRARNVDRDTIDRWHRQRGWLGVGYHFVLLNDRHDLLPDGTVQRGRPLDEPGAHVRGMNLRSLGICLVGHGDREPMTPKQEESLLVLLRNLLRRYPKVTPERVIGHREINGLVEAGELADRFRTDKTCPGRMVDMERVRELLIRL